MQQLIFILHVLTAVALAALILLQQGKGAEMGAAFGSGASQTVFGSKGATPFLVKLIAFLGAVFFATSLGIGFIASKEIKRAQAVQLPTGITQPAAPSKKKP